MERLSCSPPLFNTAHLTTSPLPSSGLLLGWDHTVCLDSVTSLPPPPLTSALSGGAVDLYPQGGTSIPPTAQT